MASLRNFKSLMAPLVLLAISAGVSGLSAQSESPNRNDLHAVVEANNQFAIDLYRKINAQDEGKNIFVSPFSVSTALAMTFEGSRNKTRTQMAGVLHLDMSDADRQTGFSSLLAETSAGPGKHYKLNVANALWGQKGYHFEAPFLSAIGKFYGGTLKIVDFAGNTEGARVEINRWVEYHTAEMIRDLIPRGALDTDTPLVLTNAIYFKGTWASQFKPIATKVEPFNVSKTVKVQTPMMHQTGHFRFIKENGVAAIELPYEDDDLSMIAILPDGDIDKMGAGLSLDQIKQIGVDMFSQDVDVVLPRFKMEAGYGMGPMLSEMGMPDAFSEKLADFSGMTGRPNLYIGKAIHKARIEVNEEGSEAAAATSIGMLEMAMERKEKAVFHADRPFLFIIVHNKTGAILFMGRLSNPSL
ncbi:MAG: serpin family protein [Terracidiphilus sp.]|jgi:serpin B